MNTIHTITSIHVRNVYLSYPIHIQKKLLTLRKLIFDTANNIEGIGSIEETLKWQEPAYLTSESKWGSTIRLGWKKQLPTYYAMYVNCQTDLIERFKRLLPNECQFEKNRAVLFSVDQTLSPNMLESVSLCIAQALTYHRPSALF